MSSPATTPEVVAHRESVRSRVFRHGNGAEVLLVLLVPYGALFVPNFLTEANLIRVIQSQAFIGLAAIGMTFIVLSGSFVDLSMAAVIAVVGNTLLLLVHQSVVLAFVVAFGAALLIGIVNGVLVGRYRVNPVIATLGVGVVSTGILLLATGGRTSSGQSDAFEAFGNLRIGAIPITTIVFLALLIAMHIVLTRTQFGYYVRLVGANRAAAAVIGARPARIVAACFVISALFAGLTGLFLAAFAGVAQNSLGSGYEFDALAAVVIGGTSLLGGRGSLVRTFLGVLVIGVTMNIMLLLGLSTPLQLSITGLIFIAVVALDAYRSGRLGAR